MVARVFNCLEGVLDGCYVVVGVFWVVVRQLLRCSIVFRVFWWLLRYSGWLLGGC